MKTNNKGRKDQPTIRFYVKPEVKQGLTEYTSKTGISLQFIFERYAEEFIKHQEEGKRL